MAWGIAWRRRSGDLLQIHDNTLDKNRQYRVMKLKTAGIILVWLASAGFARASTNDITTLVQKGLFEEEANHHLDAAIEYYQEAIGHFDKDRQLTATAIFRLGECYRLQGKTNEADVQYERVVREFSDQAQLVELSRNYLPKTNHSGSFVSQPTRLPDAKEAQNPQEQLEIGQIKDIIQNSPDLINATLPGQDPRLVTAARSGWMSAAKLLLENGAIINPESPPGDTPLTAASDAGNKGMVELLLSKGANINAVDGHQGWAPLHYAVFHGFKSVAETLIAHGADVEVRARDGNRPLHFAAERGFRSLAEVLLGHKADVNAPGKGGETALFKAIQNNQAEMVEFLISNKANVNIKSKSGETPLLSAVGKNDINIAIVKALLDSGAGVEATVRSHYPLDIAVIDGRADLVELLLQKNEDPNTLARWNVPAPQIPHTENHIDQAVTPLILAVSKDSEAQSKIAAVLLQHSANPNLADEAGNTPLDFAIIHRNTNLIGELILHHADVNAPDKQGDPPLAYVSWGDGKQREQIKQMLIQAGANEDYRRRAAIFIAQKGTGSIGNKVFSRETNWVNQYTLFELMASVYGGHAGRHIGFPQRIGGGSSGVAFPDLAHIAINRLNTDGSKEEFAVDLNEILESGDCSKNIRLEWGDIVMIPQLDHHVGEGWPGLTQFERDTLGKCLMRKVKVLVKGQPTQFALLPPIVQWISYTAAGGQMGDTWVQGGPGIISSSIAGILNGAHVLETYDLNQVVHEANVLLISSDLSRVKVTRRESEAGGHHQVMEFNLETQPPPAVSLEDGDVIEIPERDQK
jgi:ankyrin repeat protein